MVFFLSVHHLGSALVGKEKVDGCVYPGLRWIESTSLLVSIDAERRRKKRNGIRYQKEMLAQDLKRRWLGIGNS